MAEELAASSRGSAWTRSLTVEASGIALAVMTGYVFGCRAAFAKKSKSKNISDDVYSAEVVSYTHGNTNTVILSRYLHAGERVLIVDDFLATGAALEGLMSIVSQAGAELVGAGIAVEKVFRAGRHASRARRARGIAGAHRLHVRHGADICAELTNIRGKFCENCRKTSLDFFSPGAVSL